MNIVFISKYACLPEYGGLGLTRQYFLSKNIIKNNPNDRVLFIGSRSSASVIPPFKGLAIEKEEDGVDIAILNGPKIDMGFNLKRLRSWMLFEFNLWRYRKKIKAFDPDVIVVSSLSIFTFISGVYLKRKLKKPLVLEVRDIHPLTMIEIGKFSPNNPAIRLFGMVEKFGYRNADLLISPLSNAGAHFSNVLKKPFKFKWIPMGVDPEFFNNTNKPESKFNIRKDGEFLIGYAGTLGKANALEINFEAAKLLEKSHPNIKFVFIGNGPLKNQYLEQYGGLSNVVFHDAVPKRNLQFLLQEMDVLINTWLNLPIYQFGICPNKWMDYMLAAKPILVAFSGYDSIIKNANCGIVVPAEDKMALTEAIVKLSEMPKDELERMGQNGKKYLLENLQYQKLAEELRNSLADILPNTGNG